VTNVVVMPGLAEKPGVGVDSAVAVVLGVVLPLLHAARARREKRAGD